DAGAVGQLRPGAAVRRAPVGGAPLPRRVLRPPARSGGPPLGDRGPPAHRAGGDGRGPRRPGPPTRLAAPAGRVPAGGRAVPLRERNSPRPVASQSGATGIARPIGDPR